MWETFSSQKKHVLRRLENRRRPPPPLLRFRDLVCLANDLTSLYLERELRLTDVSDIIFPQSLSGAVEHDHLSSH